MNVKNKYPPNYKEIIKHFPVVEKRRGVIFTYGNTLYAPGAGKISDDLMIHEETHKLQQRKIGKKQWWTKYFKDSDFRLSQELEAYRNQYNYIKDHYGRQQRRNMLRIIAGDLSSPIYGSLISKKGAIKLIGE